MPAVGENIPDLTPDAIRLAAALRWAAFRQAGQGGDPAAVATATRALVRFLMHPHLPPHLRGVPDAEALAAVAASMREVVAWIARDGDARSEAEARHELAAFLWENQQRLPGKPLREGAAMALQALRRHQRGGQHEAAARSRHLLGLFARQLAYGGRIRDQERAIRHLARAAEAFAPTRPDLAAEALFSAIGAWGRRRIGDPVENHEQAAACWRQARALFAGASATRRELAANVEFAKVLFARRYARAAARDDLIDLLGSTFQRLADLPDVPVGSPAFEQERWLQIETLSLLGETHRTRPARTRFADQAKACFDAVATLLAPDDHPDRAAPHRLRHAVFLFEEALAGRATMAEVRAAVTLAGATARASTDVATQLAATYWDGVVLAETGEMEAALTRFEAVAAGRGEQVAGIANPFGIEERAEVASGLAAAGGLAALEVRSPLAALRFFEMARVGLSGRTAIPLTIDEARIAGLCPTGGALVCLLASRRRSVAIVAVHAGATVRFATLDLALLDHDRFRVTITTWLAALTTAGMRTSSEAVATLKAALARLLVQLGPRLARPLDRLLRRLGIGDGAEIVLIVGGEAALLPLHAAPILRGQVFVDRYRLRLAPRLGALAGSADDGQPAEGRQSVILSDPAGLGPAGVGEPDRIATLFRRAGLPAPRIVERIRSPQEIVALCRGARHLHVTAHSRFRFADPLHSAIVIGDRMVSALHVLAHQDLRGCELAFLASCESSLSDPGTGADLLTGLAAAILEAGAATVVGALWPTSDAPAAMIVDGVYRRVLGAGQTPAQALHAAMRETRARFPHPFDWAPFVVQGR